MAALPHQLLYVSRLVAGVRYDVFPAICKVSRRRNAELSLAGVLLFDGHRFCQWLEGPAASLAPVRQSIVSDPRHEFMSVLVDRPRAALATHGGWQAGSTMQHGWQAGSTTQHGWQAGYCGPDEIDLLLGPERLDEGQAQAAFRAIVTRADLSP